MSVLTRLMEALRGRVPGLTERELEEQHESEQDMGPSRLIVGLGNPGLEYSATRHNMGFLCLDRLASKHRLRFTGKRGKSVLARGAISGHDVALAKPQTYMNLSGESVRDLLRIYKMPTSALLVVYDDVDLPAGTVRIRERGGPGTHNGMRSIVDEIGTTDFPRLRIGVGTPTDGQNLADYVLGLPPPEERTVLDEALDRGVEAIETVARRGIGAAMNTFNT
jgi:PTH1 family peptidyl-tRNA hydrolase